MSDLEDDVPLRVIGFNEHQLAQIGRLATSFVRNPKPDSGDDMTAFEDVDDLRDIVQDDDLIRRVAEHAMIFAIRAHRGMMIEARKLRQSQQKQERAVRRLGQKEKDDIDKRIAAVNKLKPGLIKGPSKTEPLSEKAAAEFNQLFTTLAAMAKPRNTTNASPD